MFKHVLKSIGKRETSDLLIVVNIWVMLLSTVLRSGCSTLGDLWGFQWEELWECEWRESTLAWKTYISKSEIPNDLKGKKVTTIAEYAGCTQKDT